MKGRQFDDLSSIADSDYTLISRHLEKSNPFEFLLLRTQNRKNLQGEQLNDHGSIILDIPGSHLINQDRKNGTIEEDIDLVNLMGHIPQKSIKNFLAVPSPGTGIAFGRRQTMDLSIINEPSVMVESKTNLEEEANAKQKTYMMMPSGLIEVPEGPTAAERSFNMANAISQFKE
jgi:hypothetical protein